MGVLEAPRSADAAIVELEEVHLGYASESSAGWCVTEPLTGMGSGADEPGSECCPSATRSTISISSSVNESRNGPIQDRARPASAGV